MTARPDLPLRTKRLVLRPYRAGDVDSTLAYSSDRQVSRYLLTNRPLAPPAR
jgi:hypothetical protein